jgi:hypothetical protein
MTTPAYAPPAPPSPQLANDARAALRRQVGVRAHADERVGRCSSLSTRRGSPATGSYAAVAA